MIFPEIVIDESVDFRILIALRDTGYNVYSIAQNNAGINDKEVIRIALEKNAFIITEDKDFGDEIIFKKSAHHGTLLLRLHGLEFTKKNSIVLDTLEKYSKDLLHAFSVLTPTKLRIRKI